MSIEITVYCCLLLFCVSIYFANLLRVAKTLDVTVGVFEILVLIDVDYSGIVFLVIGEKGSRLLRRVSSSKKFFVLDNARTDI